MPRCATRFTSARCSSSSQSRSSRYYLLGLAGHEAVPPPFSWPAAARNRDGWGCNGGTRDLIQINETMPITLSIVVAAIEKRLKCQQRFLGRNAVRPFSRTFWRGVTVASEESLRLHTGASAPPKPAMSLRMTARPAKRLTFRAIPTMPACCFGAWRRSDRSRRTRKQRSLAVPRAAGTMHIVPQQGTLCARPRAGGRRARESRLAASMPRR